MVDPIDGIKQAYLSMRSKYPSNTEMFLYINEDFFLSLQNNESFSKTFSIKKYKIKFLSIDAYLVRGEHPEYRFVIV